ncbi:SusC/RagA family TonB-linked outer membrane protein [Bacteroides sp. Marseille-P3684]|uniref:SusC/RagA family TonB-linked outer membrane protein n=1 Tax=Bacteroides sp. Marseille-P3684 TaxID=2086579 RepID=UPI001F315B96|nr:SusC/RagA family TonB-linked outer membrane protein [Bacteroides sp. Marseille-P3684]
MKSHPTSKTYSGAWLRVQRRLPALLLAFASATCAWSINLDDVHPVTLRQHQVSVRTALDEIARQSGVNVMYREDHIDTSLLIRLDLKDASLQHALEAVCRQAGLTFELKDDYVLITRRRTASADETSVYQGKVTDGNGEPLIGATVRVKGTATGAVTDLDGRYSIRARVGDVLQVSYIGMKTRDIVVNARARELTVVLEDDATMLDEVVTTGFQTISRERNTGSAVIVSREELEKVQAPTLTDKLEGMVTGLNSYGSALSIRGVSSFATGTTPLLVVDGQVVNQDLSTLNPDDIATITVLKDAASTSLYGVRASNGVIVVTTRTAKDNKTRVNASANFYFTPRPSLDYMHYATASDVIDYEQEWLLTDPTYSQDPGTYFAERNDISNGNFGALSRIERLYYDLYQGNLTQAELDSRLDALRSNNYAREYRDRLQRLQFKQDYNLSVSKGGEHINTYFSARYEGTDHTEKNADTDKLSLYLKSAIDFTDWFRFTYGSNVSYTNYRTGQSDYGMNSFLAYERIYDDAGNPVYQYPYNYYRSQELEQTDGLKSMRYNAAEENRYNLTDTRDLYLRLFAHADFKLAKGLDLGIKFQYEDTRRDQELYDEAESYRMRRMINEFATADSYGQFTYHIPDGGHQQTLNERYGNMNLRAQLNYQRTFGGRHDVVALIGGEIRQDKATGTASERYGFDSRKLTNAQVDWATLTQDGVIGQLYSGVRKKSELLSVTDVTHRYVSAYANAGYTYNNTYSVNASVRVEQADLFGTDPKYRYRPLWSVGASWNVSNEAFMQPYEWVDMLKVRMTYGITGNVDQNSSPYLIGNYSTSSVTNSQITGILTPPNRLLRWEKTSTFNFGVDFAFLRRLSGSVEFYRRYSSDLLANKTLDPSTGFETARVNNGAMKNIGFEANLSYDWALAGDWRLNTSLTASYNRNTIEEVGYTPSSASEMLANPYDNYLKGDTYGTVYAYRYAGLDAQGDPSVYNENGEVVSNVNVDNIAALVNKGQLTPKWQGAFTLDLGWRRLSFYTKLVYYTGHALRNDVTPLYRNLFDRVDGTAVGGIHEDIARRWTTGNPNTDIPRMGVHDGYESFRNQQWKYADAHVLNASFLKVRNIGLSYDLPTTLIAPWGLQGVRLHAQVDNPFYWAACGHGIDPERFDANQGSRAYSQLTSYMLGLTVNF